MNYSVAEVKQMKKSGYRPRLIDVRVDEYLSAFGEVCIANKGRPGLPTRLMVGLH